MHINFWVNLKFQLQTKLKSFAGSPPISFLSQHRETYINGAPLYARTANAVKSRTQNLLDSEIRTPRNTKKRRSSSTSLESAQIRIPLRLSICVSLSLSNLPSHTIITHILLSPFPAVPPTRKWRGRGEASKQTNKQTNKRKQRN